MTVPLLAVNGLEVCLPTDEGDLRAVDGLGFRLNEGELLGIVGESGSGKTQTALALMGLTPANSRVTGSARGCRRPVSADRLGGRGKPRL